MNIRAPSRGVTLVELLVAIVVAALVMTGITAILVQNQRIATQSREQVVAQQTVRAGIEIVSSELRELSPALGDISGLDSDELTVRAVRGAGIICAIPGRSPLQLHVRNLGRLFAEDDPVTFFVADTLQPAQNDYWATGTLDDAQGGVTCPSGVGAQALQFASVNPGEAAGGVQLGGIVRAFETWTYGAVTHEGLVYVGRRAGGGAAVPLVGPIDANGGLRFVYRDANGAVTSTPADVRTIELTLRTTSRARGEGGRIIADSLTTLIHLRN